MDTRYTRRHAAIAVALSAGLAGCTLGPNFQPPAVPVADGAGYTPTPLPAQTVAAPVAGGAAQRLVDGMDIPAQWWSVFQSPE